MVYFIPTRINLSIQVREEWTMEFQLESDMEKVSSSLAVVAEKSRKKA